MSQYGRMWVLTLCVLGYSLAAGSDGGGVAGDTGWDYRYNLDYNINPALNEQVAQEHPEPRSRHSASAQSFHYGPNPYKLPQIESASSDDLIELYRAQAPRAPELPPALLPGSQAAANSLSPAIDEEDWPAAGYNYPAPVSSRRTRQAPPAPPRYPTSMMLKGELTAHKADYTEPYTAWYDGTTGSSRVDFHDGASSSYRMMMPNGDVQHVLTRVRRGAGAASPRCVVSAPQPAGRARAAPPALPDLSDFSFGGFTSSPKGKTAEVWKRSKREVVGGEELTHRHELTLERLPDDTARPLRYAVTTDSSVLGAGSDSYELRYREARAVDVPQDLLHIDVESACEEVQAVNASAPTKRSLLDPLSGFVQPVRDALFTDFFDKFTQDFGRKYVDKAEKVLRMNVLGQTWRWLQAFNRQGATFEVGVNFLADRLDAELAALRGVAAPGERRPAERFPHAAADTQRLAAELPDAFDWRERGAVTPPRYQGECASCWAFAVTAAVEGALWAAAGRLQPLAEQALVDCGNRTGAHGCGGTWPSFAYDYVQEVGLPARDAYTPYAEKVLKCRDEEVKAVTRISAHVNVTADSVPALKVAISKHAPVVVIIDATPKSFIFYKKGVLFDDRCGKKRGQLNHAVTAVGWGTVDGEPHIIAKNSWSDKWGEEGYVRLQARSNTCGVLTVPSYPRLEPADAGVASSDPTTKPSDKSN